MDFSNLVLRIVAVLTILITVLIIGRVFGRLVYNILKEFDVNKRLRQKGFKIPLEEMISLGFKYIVYTFGVILSLNLFNLFGTFLKVILIIFLILISIFFMISLWWMVPNYITGLYLRKDITKDSLKNFKGKIIKKDKFSVLLRQPNGDIVSVPYFYMRKDVK